MSIAHIRRRAIAVAAVSATGLALGAGPAAAQTPMSLKAGFMSNSSHTAISGVGAALETIARKN
jgi:hypothetical protein